MRTSECPAAILHVDGVTRRGPYGHRDRDQRRKWVRASVARRESQERRWWRELVAVCIEIAALSVAARP